jgi:type I restriction enzyme S subunit
MSSEWIQVTIGDLVGSGEAIVQTGPFGSQLHKHDYVEDGAPIIPTEAIGRGRILDITVPRISKEKAEELSRHRLLKDDILFARRGAQATGCSAIVDDRYVGGICGTGALLLRVNSPRVHPHYLSLFLSSNFAFEWLRTYAVGAVMPNLNTAIIKALPFTLPSLAEQKELSTLFSAIDDRIVLLRESNTTLEAIAQALFKSWFIDFDPVRAKAEGREPDGLDAETAGLFPSAFEESTLDSIPKGWQVGAILEIASLLSGGTPKTDRLDYWGGNIAWASAKDVSQSSSSALIRTERTITQKGLSESATRLIPALATVVVARGATTGRMVFFGREMAMNQTCYGLTSKIGTPVALYCHMKQQIDKLVNAAHGSVFDTITTNTFSQSMTVLPPKPLLECYERVAGPLFQKIVAGTEAIDALSSLRDALLPRLISGQLRLPEAEAMLKDVA